MWVIVSSVWAESQFYSTLSLRPCLSAGLPRPPVPFYLGWRLHFVGILWGFVNIHVNRGQNLEFSAVRVTGIQIQSDFPHHQPLKFVFRRWVISPRASNANLGTGQDFVINGQPSSLWVANHSLDLVIIMCPVEIFIKCLPLPSEIESTLHVWGLC